MKLDGSGSHSGSHAIHILFLETTHQDPWLNQLTSGLGTRVHGRGFCHVEICIPHMVGSRSKGFLGSSIYNGEHVTVSTRKTFANPGYVVHTESVSSEQLRKLSEAIIEANRKEIQFDRLGMCLAILPFATPLSSSSSRTFCSRYVTELLQMIGLVPSLDPRITTPSKLYRSLRESSKVGIVGTVEHKQALLGVDPHFSIE